MHAATLSITVWVIEELQNAQDMCLTMQSPDTCPRYLSSMLDYYDSLSSPTVLRT